MIGILDLQGDVLEHLDHLNRIGIKGVRVKDPDGIKGLAGLIIPGGESTCLSRLMHIFDISSAITEEYRKGMKIWGTCAGAILLATSVAGEKSHLGLIDMEIERNSFGSQLDSFSCTALISGISSEPLPLTFIRAPKILRVGPGVKVLLQMDDFIAAAESEGVLTTVFHPELTDCIAFHHYFARKCGLRLPERISVHDHTWNNRSWTRYARVVSR
jgi:pyridoxal 5'-phosphate synthase pdxT subunit